MCKIISLQIIIGALLLTSHSQAQMCSQFLSTKESKKAMSGDKNQLQEQVLQIKEALEKDPNNLSLIVEFLGLNLRNKSPQGRQDQVYYSARRIELEGASSNNLSKFYSALSLAGQKESALGLAKTLYQQNPRQLTNQMRYIKSLKANQNLTEAISVGERILEAQPENTEIIRFMSQTYHSLAFRPNQSIEVKKDHLQRSLELDQELLRNVRGDYKDFTRVLDTMVALRMGQPVLDFINGLPSESGLKDYTVLSYKARSYIQLKDFVRAQENIDQMKLIHPEGKYIPILEGMLARQEERIWGSF